MDRIAEDFYLLLEIISAKAKTGIAFSPNPYDIDRFKDILSALEQMYELISSDDNLSKIFRYLKTIQVYPGDQEYVTPKVAVATVTFNQKDEVLLVKRTEGIWALPGGYADISFDPIQNAEKEAKEETGFDVKVKELIGIFDSRINKFPSIGRQVYALVFYTELIGGELTPNIIETCGAGFFSLSHMPLVHPITVAQINHGMRIHRGEILRPIIEHT